jgi:hypothetical protein
MRCGNREGAFRENLSPGWFVPSSLRQSAFIRHLRSLRPPSHVEPRIARQILRPHRRTKILLSALAPALASTRTESRPGFGMPTTQLQHLARLAAGHGHSLAPTVQPGAALSSSIPFAPIAAAPRRRNSTSKGEASNESFTRTLLIGFKTRLSSADVRFEAVAGTWDTSMVLGVFCELMRKSSNGEIDERSA